MRPKARQRTAKWWQLERRPPRPPGPWQRRIGEWLTGPPLPKSPSRLEQMRLLRRVSFRTMLFYLPIMLVVIVTFGISTVVGLFFGGLVVFGLANVASLTLKIGRAEAAKRERD